MINEFKVYERNPHVLRKLVRFTGYIPANIVDKAEKTVTPVKISKHDQELLMKDKKAQLDIDYDGKKYHTKISKIHMDEASKDIDEIELAVIS